MAMAHSDEDIELLSSEIWPQCVGKWRLNEPVPIPGLPCSSTMSDVIYSPLADGTYPFEVTSVVKCCLCCTITDKVTGNVTGDGKLITSIDGKGNTTQGTLVSMDAKSKKATYQLTGTSQMGPISGTSVVEPGVWIDTVHVKGRTTVFTYAKTS